MKPANARLRAPKAVICGLVAGLAVTALGVDAGHGRAEAATPPILDATFETLPTGAITPERFVSAFGGTWYGAANLDDTSIVTASGHGRVIRTKLDANTYRSSPGNNGIAVFVPLRRQVDRACVSYDIRFGSSFPFDLGGKLPGLEGVAPGVSPSTPAGGGNPGSKGWSARQMWLGPGAYSWATPKNQGVSYLYGPKQVSKYGDNVRWSRSFVAGKWHTVKVCHAMNTVGKADGVLRVWFDGTRVVNNTSYVYRLRNDVRVSHLAWSIFRGGGDSSWAASTSGTVDIDNVRVTEGI